MSQFLLVTWDTRDVNLYYTKLVPYIDHTVPLTEQP